MALIMVVEAPPGRLGLTLTTRREARFGFRICAPEVEGLTDDSPLVGNVAAGWRLLKVDDVDTSRLTCEQAVAVLTTRCALVRKLSFSTAVTTRWTQRGGAMVVGLNVFIVAVSILWLTVLHPKHLRPELGAVGGSAMTGAWCLATIGGVRDYWRCILATPGFATATVVRASTSSDVTSCDRCRWPKPHLARHCTTCRRCVLRMDHHCDWLDSCVGKLNYRFFLRLELQLLLATFLSAAGCGIGAARHYRARRHFAALPMVTLAIMLVFIGGLLLRCVAMHVMLLHKRQTTVAYLYSPKPAVREGAPKRRAPLSARELRSILEEDVFGTGSLRASRWPCVADGWLWLVWLYADSPTLQWLAQRFAIH